MNLEHSHDPWIAVNLSMIWPGIGQLYCRAIFKGTSMAITNFIFLFAIWWSLFSPGGNTLTGLLLILVLVILYIFNLLDAYNTIRPLPKTSPSNIYQPRRNRWYAIFLSQILPGFGHLYLQKALWGGLFLALGVLTASLANTYVALLPVPPIIGAIACYHLYRTIPHQQIPPNRSAPNRSANLIASPSPLGSSQHWVILTVMLGLLVVRLSAGYIPVWVNQSVLQCIVPSSSMASTLLIGDRIFVQRDPDYQPQLGDVIVFHPPAKAIAMLNTNPNSLFVKRIVGLPNQTITIQNGQVWINQEPVIEPYATPADYALAPITIPPKSYFVLGDNRNQSADSHVWGFLPIDDIVGKAYKIYWPPQRIQSLGEQT